MSANYKDYYAVLGVPRDADADTIKAAFRKLARQYHPDVAKDKKTAEAKFKEINEANEVLSDPVKRRKYDELGADWERAGPPPRPPQPGSGTHTEYHFGGTGFSDFFEQFFGGRRADATDFEDLFDAPRQRRGARPAEDFSQRGADIEGDIMVTLDEVMHGSMRTVSLQRTNPETGESETETFKVRIPPGAQEERRIRVPGKGEPGFGGAGAGDLYLRVRIAAHPDFRVRGSDLYHDLDLAPWEAVLGATVSVPTLGGTARLHIPPGSDNGQSLRLRGQGLPTARSGVRGDLYAVINVRLPQHLSESERAAWEALRRTSHFTPRAA